MDQPHTRVLLYLPVPHHTLNLAREALLVYVPSTVLYRIAGNLITIINLCCNTPPGDHVMVTDLQTEIDVPFERTMKPDMLQVGTFGALSPVPCIR